jgi:hypothetical protein
MTEIKYGAAKLDFELPIETLEKYYNKLVPYRVIEEKRKLLIKDGPTRNIAYLWLTDKAPTQAPKDQIDEDFLSGKLDASLILTMSIIGVHSCAYYGCFKPDIVEVCNLLSMHLKEERLEKIDRIYATTEPYPNDSVDCILHDGSGHYGESTYHLVYKTNPNTNPNQVAADWNYTGNEKSDEAVSKWLESVNVNINSLADAMNPKQDREPFPLNLTGKPSSTPANIKDTE